jgi:hypothetical protein
MPPRTVTLGIIAVWLAAVGWMAYREWWREPEPPPLLDRTDEVGRQTARWSLRLDGEKVGTFHTTLARSRGDSLFWLRGELTGEFRYCGFAVRALKSSYRVTARGKFRGLECEVALGALAQARDLRLTVQLDGSRFTARVSRPGAAGPTAIPSEGPGGVLSLLHPLHRMPGLYEGRQWHVVAFDPLELALDARPGGQEGEFRLLDATTTLDSLSFGDRPVPCWRVDLRERDKLRARVWARAEDGLVVRQEVHSRGGRMEMERQTEQTPSVQPPRGMPRLPRRVLTR